MAATQIGMQFSAISEATAGALVAAGLLSVLVFRLLHLLSCAAAGAATPKPEEARAIMEAMRSET